MASESELKYFLPDINEKSLLMLLVLKEMIRMISDSEIVNYLDDYLRVDEIDDYGTNGIQIDAPPPIDKIGFTVDCRIDVVNRAVQEDIDILFCHHGLIWGGLSRVTESNYDIIKLLMDNDTALYQAHLPLDIHPEVGNNVELARLIGAKVKDTFFESKGEDVALMSELPEERYVRDVASILSEKLDTETVALQENVKVKRVGMMTGKGGDALLEAKERGADLFITGEREHSVYTEAVNNNIPIIMAGHYATETLGVRALKDKVEKKFDIDCRFISSETPL